ncbi:hypothetical protein HPSH465_0765 [Glaesserella parasuis H465]|nr:hypothetical protein HPSH465_0765 [Glaesserella parasuis H465]
MERLQSRHRRFKAGLSGPYAVMNYVIPLIAILLASLNVRVEYLRK